MKLWQSRKAMQTETPTESSPAPQHKQSRFSHLGIRWRLVGSFAMFVALLLMLLWLLQIVFLESFYKSIKTSSIKNTAEEVAASINDENFYTEVNRLTRQDLICVHIIREDGTPVLTSGNQPSCILHMLLTDQAALLLAVPWLPCWKTISSWSFPPPCRAKQPPRPPPPSSCCTAF